MTYIDFYMEDKDGNEVLLNTYKDFDEVENIIINQYVALKKSKNKNFEEETDLTDEYFYKNICGHELNEKNLSEINEYVSQIMKYSRDDHYLSPYFYKEIYDDMDKYFSLLNDGNKLYCNLGCVEGLIKGEI